MSILLYLDESELSLIFKSLRYLSNYEASEELLNLRLKLGLLHGDLDEEDSDGSTSDSTGTDGSSTTEQFEDDGG
jgi:hypothetical protein